MWHIIKVKGLPDNSFEINDKFEIRRIKTKRVLKYKLTGGNGKPYYAVRCTIKGVRKYKYVHRAIAETFIPNPKNKPEVNHIDGNKLNNNIENLEWVTRKENNDHAIETGLSSPHEVTEKRKIARRNSALKNRKLTMGQAKRIRNDYSNTGNKAVGAIFGVRAELIRRIRAHETYKH